MKKLTLITGGARSGKSSYGLKRAEALSASRLFVATCPDIDGEMSERVARHRKEREGRGWQTVECELDLDAVFDKYGAGYDVILIDCLTLWVNNLLFAAEKTGELFDDHVMKSRCQDWLEKIEDYPGQVICVTNEVGLGIVPDNPLARKYRDLVGTCNQLIGMHADEVVFVSCGIPLFLKQEKDNA